MNIKKLLTDDNAVSPVIGVILMVAITVILAAVIGTFVLGIGQDQQTTPSASFDFNWAGTTLTITHSGGDTFNTDNSETVEVVGPSVNTTDWITAEGDSEISAGDTIEVTPTAGDTVRVVWTAPGGGKTQTVASFEVPT